MKKYAKLSRSQPEFMEEIFSEPVLFDKEDYLFRINRLLERMKKYDLTHVLIYADREHFSNLYYYTGYDSRFEESLFILDADGKKNIFIGNEGMGYSYVIPYDIKRVLYQNFSLQGQPREKLQRLSVLFHDAGIETSSKVGVVGSKYFDTEHTGEPKYTFDLPAYILQGLFDTCPAENVINFTAEIIGLPDGERARIYSAKEIAWAESAANRVSVYVQRMMKALKPGRSEIDLSRSAAIDFEPTNVFPMVSFGSKNVALGLGSPTTRRLLLGELCKVCYSLRGNLTSRVGIAAYRPTDCINGLDKHLESFFFRYWEGVASWYEALHINCTGGDLYNAVHSRVDTGNMSIALNPGHYIGTEEWLNSSSYKCSDVPILHDCLIQADIIGVSKANDELCAICEDGVAIAGPELLCNLRKDYPAVYERILKRQEMMRLHLGIDLQDEVLPLSQLTGAYFPFMLDLDTVLRFE